MKKLAIPAILAFWFIIVAVGILVMNRRPPPPPPPDWEIPTPPNVEVGRNERGEETVRILTDSGDTVAFTAGPLTLVEYEGPVDGTPYHLVWQGFEDGDNYTSVVDERTGQQISMTGHALPSPSGSLLASAGSNRVVGYSKVDVVELGPEGLEPRVALDARRLGLWVNDLRWSKSGAVTVMADRGYVTFCETDAEPELVLTENEDGTWDVWLDGARSVAAGDSLHTSIVDAETRSVEGRFVGEIPGPADGGPVRVFDPDWSPIPDLLPPESPARLLMDLGSSSLEVDGWPAFDPAGYRFATAELACGPPNGPEHGIQRPITVYEPLDDAYQALGTFDPAALGWSGSGIRWDGNGRIEVPGWIDGAIRLRLLEGDWIPAGTGAFEIPLPSGAVGPGILEDTDALGISLRKGPVVATLPSPEAPEGPYRYLGFSPDMGAHLVRAGAADAATYLLVHHDSGRIWPVPGVPIPNPGHTVFAAFRPSDDPQELELFIFGWSEAEGPVQLWNERMPADAEGLEWSDDRYLWLGEGDAVQLNRFPDGAYRWSRGVG